MTGVASRDSGGRDVQGQRLGCVPGLGSDGDAECSCNVRKVFLHSFQVHVNDSQFTILLVLKD